MSENVLQAESITGFNSKDFLRQEMKKTVNYYLKKRLLKIINPYGTSIFTGKNFL